MIRKCTICIFGSWVSGLSALAWGAVGIFNPFGFELWARILLMIVGATGISFLYYQPPFPSCPRCMKVNNLV